MRIGQLNLCTVYTNERQRQLVLFFFLSKIECIFAKINLRIIFYFSNFCRCLMRLRSWVASLNCKAHGGIASYDLYCRCGNSILEDGLVASLPIFVVKHATYVFNLLWKSSQLLIVLILFPHTWMIPNWQTKLVHLSYLQVGQNWLIFWLYFGRNSTISHMPQMQLVPSQI